MHGPLYIQNQNACGCDQTSGCECMGHYIYKTRMLVVVSACATICTNQMLVAESLLKNQNTCGCECMGHYIYKTRMLVAVSHCVQTSGCECMGHYIYKTRMLVAVSHCVQTSGCECMCHYMYKPDACS